MAAFLVIDDYDGFREAMAYCLPKFGHTAYTVTNVSAAENIMETHAVDLILLNAGYPAWPGLAACTALKRKPRLARIPVVLLSHIVTPDLAVRGRAAGAEAVMAKPVEWAELMQLVARLVPNGGGDAG